MGKMSKIGAVWAKKDESGHFIKLGNENKKNPKYNLSVEIIVRDHEGNVVLKQTDGFLTLSDPRAKATADSNEQALASLEKVPNLLFEVLAANS